MSRLHELIPGGCHTYSKGDDRFPSNAPATLQRGKGGMVYDPSGRDYVDWGMGINTVLIGHAEEAIDEAAIAALRGGQAFCRPSEIEEAAAETVLRLYPHADMIKFCKNGSDANNAAIRLARAVTGRPHIAYDASAPFLSTADWFCHAQPKWAGTLDAERAFAIPFQFNNVDSLVQAFNTRPLACVILEVCRTAAPTPAFVEALRDYCALFGTLLVVDEVVTGYRYGLHGVAPRYGLLPDLFTLGKGIANGYSLAALCGTRAVMRRGAEDVFLLSTTNGAERSALAAAIATAAFYEQHDVIGQLHDVGEALTEMVTTSARATGAKVRAYSEFGCRPALLMSPATRDAFYWAVCDAGVLLPPAWACPCFRRTAEELERTRTAIHQACARIVSFAA